MIFSSNQDDIDRRHLWRVSVADGRARAITKGQGIEWAPVPLSDGAAIAFCRSDARRPARAAIVVGNAEPRDLSPDAVPADFPSAALRLAFESSPMASIKSWRSPALLIHGDDDRNVPFSESVTLAETLRAQGVHVEQLVFPDEVHGFLRHANWLRAYHAAAAFFERFLGKP